jgi:P27 family predicted phage terminase small subunit
VRPLAKLTPAAAAIWRELGAELHRMNVLRESDRQAFARYCADVVEYWNVSAKLRKEGHTYTVTSAHGTYNRLNPLLMVQDRLATRLDRMDDRFGLTPASRQALMVRLASKQPDLPGLGHPGAPAEEDPIGFLN